MSTKVKFPLNWMSKYPLVSSDETRKVLKQHCYEVVDHPHLFHVHTPIKVFKKVLSIAQNSRVALANLIIPVGAMVHHDQYSYESKCRASSAICVSIWQTTGYSKSEDNWETGSFVQSARSQHISGSGGQFIYKCALDYTVKKALEGVPELILREHANFIKPREKFDLRRDTCSSGIHFFTAAGNALRY